MAPKGKSLDVCAACVGAVRGTEKDKRRRLSRERVVAMEEAPKVVAEASRQK
jgi:hypothetical protein